MKEEQRRHLRHYLLGALDEKEREDLAARYFIDEELFDELLDVENELFDQCVRDELSAQEKKQFASYIQSLPDGTAKLATAQAILHSTSTATVIRKEPKAKFVSFRQSIQNLFFGKQPLLQYGLSFALILVLALTVYFYIHQRHLQKENEQLQARTSQIEREKEILSQQTQHSEQQQTEQQERIRQLEEELAIIKARKENDKPENETPVTISTIVSLILTPALRSEGKVDKLELTPKTREVSISVLIDSREQIPNYRALIQINEGNGRIIFDKLNLKPSGKDRNRKVVFKIPVKILTAQNYKLTLQGRTDDGIDIALDYYFQVARK